MRRPLSILGLMVGLIVGFWVTRSSPEKEIDRRFDRIESLVAKESAEANLATAGKMRSLMEMFHDPFEFRAEPFDFVTRDARSLAGAVQQYRAGSARVTMQVGQREIHVDSSSGRATSYVVATFSGGIADLERDRFRFQVNWIEVDDEWKIDYVDLVEVLSR